jgi:uncharacterized protein YbgA (DUF1722 family)
MNIERDFEIINELYEIENNFIRCIIKLEKAHEKYKLDFVNKFSDKSKNLVDVLKDLSDKSRKDMNYEYKIKYEQILQELEVYKIKINKLNKMSKPIISKNQMRILLQDQEKIQKIIKKINVSKLKI